MDTTTPTRFTFRDAPDLMERLISTQNRLRTPIDIVTFAGFCDSRAELERHVVHYEQKLIEESVR